MNINRLKALSSNLVADAYDIDAEIAGIENRPESVAHYIKLAGSYRQMAETYQRWADEDEKRNAIQEGAK